MPKAQEPFEILDNVCALVKVAVQVIGHHWDIRTFDPDGVEPFPVLVPDIQLEVRVEGDKNGMPRLAIHTNNPDVTEQDKLMAISFAGSEITVEHFYYKTVGVLTFPSDPRIMRQAMYMKNHMGLAIVNYMISHPSYFPGAKLSGPWDL